MTAEAFADLLGARRMGLGWVAKCPSHQGKRPSLSIREAQDGRVLVYCWAGCERTQILAALGLTSRDLLVGPPLTPAKIRLLASQKAIPDSEDPSPPMATSRGSFFAIDRRIWAAVCDRGEMNPAVAYLVLAQGTGRSNLATSWSVTALKTWTGIDWERGKLAIKKLVDQGFIQHGEKHTPQKPRYELASWSEIFQKLLKQKRASLTEYHRTLLTDLGNGWQPYKSAKSTKKALDEMVATGNLFREKDCYTLTPTGLDGDIRENLIWLPNSLILGTERGEEPPVRRLRSNGDVWTLRLLVDLYYSQNLRADGGISPHVIRERWERMSVGQQGIFDVWAFKPGQKTLWWANFESHRHRPKPDANGDHPIWENIGQLERQGLLAFVPHLWESEQPDAEPIHPYGIKGIGGEPPEIEIGTAAHLAGLAAGLGTRIDDAREAGFAYLAPVKNTLPNVQMIGVARLTYRPQTKRTKAWWDESSETAQTWLRNYGSMYVRAEQPRKIANGGFGMRRDKRYLF